MRLKKRQTLLDYHGQGANQETGHKPSAQQPTNEKIGLPVGEGIRYIKLTEVLKCEAERAYCNFYLTSGEKILVSKPMKEFEAQLEQSGFIRVHKSYIVNMDCVQTYARGKVEIAPRMAVVLPFVHEKKKLFWPLRVISNYSTQLAEPTESLKNTGT